MKRIIKALSNSLYALKYLLSHERAIQQEAIILLLALPIAFFIAHNFSDYILLIGALVFVLIIEIINSAIEASCNALTRDYRDEIRIAKDAGSLAVALAIILAVIIWGWYIYKFLFY